MKIQKKIGILFVVILSCACSPSFSAYQKNISDKSTSDSKLTSYQYEKIIKKSDSLDPLKNLDLDLKIQSLSKLIPTVYYKPTIQLENQDCNSNALIDLKTTQGKILTSLCRKDYDLCRIQGSCFIKDGDKLIKSINFHTQVGGEPRFVEVNMQDCPYGYGVRNICLDPYFTVAADMDYYRPGDVIFVEAVKGVELVNGEKHSGFFIVRDRGGGIEGPHRFDFFTGLDSHYSKKNPFKKLGLIDPGLRFGYRKATEEEAKDFRKTRSFPKSPESLD